MQLWGSRRSRSIFAVCVVSVAVVTTLFVEGSGREAILRPSSSRSRADASTRSVEHAPSRDASTMQSLDTAPRALRAAYVAATQAEAARDARYRMARDSNRRAVTAHGGDLRLSARFDRRGATFRAPGIDGRLDARTLRCDGRSIALQEGEPTVDADAANRVRSTRAGRGSNAYLDEWYVAGPLGFEHGFDVSAPSCEREIAVELDVRGLVPRLQDDAVRLASPHGDAALRYADLVAHDAEGRELESSLSVEAGRIALRVDVSGAAFPVAIDPLVYVEDGSATPSVLGDPSSKLFGTSVAFDVDTAIVGAPTTTSTGNSSQGAAYVFRRQGSTWSYEAKLVGGDAGAQRFGDSVDISGDRAIVGAPSSTGLVAGAGAAYVFTRSGTTWTQQQKLRGDTASSQFGVAVAIDGTTVAVGQSQADPSGHTDQGAAHVYVWDGTTWALQADLLAGDGAAGDQFGTSVALEGDTVIVGSPLDDFSSLMDRGSAYVFVRSGATWSEQQKLSSTVTSAGARLGGSVSISVDTVVLGAAQDSNGLTVPTSVYTGSAYVFTRSGTVWSLQQKLIVPSAAASDQIGASVTISGDTVLAGAPLRNVGADTDEGSAFVFVRSGATWTVQTELVTVGAAAADHVGRAVTLAGDVALLGAPDTDVGNYAGQGAIRGFLRSGSTWSQEAPLVAGEGLSQGSLGVSVALSGDTAVVGEYRHDGVSGTRNGAAHVFVRVGGVWTRQARLVPFDGASSDEFGSSVAIDGDTLAIGAPLASVGGNAQQGAVYVFVRAGGQWSLQAKLLGSSGAASNRFGSAVALLGDRLFVGASGATVGGNASQGRVHVFGRSGSAWNETQVMVGSDAGAGDSFGDALALSPAGDLLVVGARGDDVGANANQGSVYAFVLAGASFVEQAKLIADDGAQLDELGAEVAVSGNTLVAGAWLADVGGVANQGAAYVFVRAGTTWSRQAKLVADDGADSDSFGRGLAVDGDTVLVGSALADVGGQTNRGAVYGFVRNGTTWSQQAKLVASDGAAADYFGNAVALAGGTTVIGAQGKKGPASYPNPSVGGVYFGTLLATPGLGCENGAECTTGFCVDGVCCDTACGGGAPDDCMACIGALTGGTDGTCASLAAPVASTVVCRASGGVCDPAETCQSGSIACPAQVFAATDVTCRAASGVCDVAETCTGASADCPSDAFASSGVPCRPSNGSCDLAETCTGASAQCPADAFASSSVVCRASVGACDVAESCTGTSAACPSDASATPGTACGPAPSGVCDAQDVCEGAVGATATCAPRYAAASQACGAASCSGGSQTSATSCTGSSSVCPAGAVTGCGGYACGATTCLSTCVSDTDCTSDHYCDNGSCAAKLALGLGCTEDRQCGTDHCVDHVCCGSVCNGQCESCGEAGHEGSCIAVAGAPRNGRTACATDGTACGGSCDGVSPAGCAFPAGETSCRAASCSTGTATQAASCDGAGSCPTLVTVACAPLSCNANATACQGSCIANADCDAGMFCLAGSCVPVYGDGHACDADAQCGSSHCTDGFCCASSCDGQCEACGEPGHEGQCVAVTGAPRPGRAACASDGTACGGSCDGVVRSSCFYADGTISCGAPRCDGEMRIDHGQCGGNGACVDPPATLCANGCSQGACLPVGPGSDGGAPDASVGDGGGPDAAGPAPDAGVGAAPKDSGCSCRAAGAGGEAPPFVAWLVVLALFVVRLGRGARAGRVRVR